MKNNDFLVEICSFPQDNSCSTSYIASVHEDQDRFQFCGFLGVFPGFDGLHPLIEQIYCAKKNTGNDKQWGFQLILRYVSMMVILGAQNHLGMPQNSITQSSD